VSSVGAILFNPFKKIFSLSGAILIYDFYFAPMELDVGCYFFFYYDVAPTGLDLF